MADREQGVDFGTVDSLIQDISYPITVTELVSRYGDSSIERTNADPITIRELFDEMGDEIFESSNDLRQGVLNVMPEESVGRENYSDRGGSAPQETDTVDDENTDVSL